MFSYLGKEDLAVGRRLCAIVCLCLALCGCVTAPEEQMQATQVPAATEAIYIPAVIATDSDEMQETTLPQQTEEDRYLGPVEPFVDLSDGEFVCVRKYIPTIAVELKYATQDNITGEVIYDFTEAYLRYGTVKKLQRVQEELQDQGLSLKIWDGFRPVEAQFALWEAYPVAGFVANPNNGYSSHSRGNTVDVTLVDGQGNELVMPTGFDAFSSRADRDYSDCTPEERANALILETVMRKYGFQPYSAEWWHFSDQDTYPVEKNFVPDCSNEINSDQQEP